MEVLGHFVIENNTYILDIFFLSDFFRTFVPEYILEKM